MQFYLSALINHLKTQMRQQDTQQTCQKYGTIVAIIWWHIIKYMQQILLTHFCLRMTSLFYLQKVKQKIGNNLVKSCSNSLPWHLLASVNRSPWKMNVLHVLK
jgi:hypothetical protein